ncbi:MAG: amylo-alpha-1,6-glucosidase [Desulfobacterales bacterium]|jgi:predicted glycogen debranching enzyme
MKIQFDHNLLQNVDTAIQHEWLETNGLGGWASSTIIGAHTRRYHGLLVAALRPPVGRVVLLSKLDETIEFNTEQIKLGTNLFPGAVHPEGYRYLQFFSKHLFPHFIYETGGVRLKKTIAAVNGENTTLILYEVLEAPAVFTLTLQPFIAGRDYHGLMIANDAIGQHLEFEDGILTASLYDGLPELYLYVPNSEFTANPQWHFNFEYPVEKYRGQDFQEDLFTPGTFKLQLKSGDQLGVIVSLRHPADRNAFDLLEREKDRRKKLIAPLKVRDDITETLALAADQFVVQRGQDQKTIIAGYHWFTDWGRDTMIALPGLTLTTGRFEDAKKILRAFAQHVSQGMLPNRFPDSEQAPEYNTVDATLWFFIAIYRYLRYTRDTDFVRDELMPVLQDIIDWHDKGTRYNISVDSDGLLSAGEPGVQLTWMDAKIDDWVVTPRSGKAVEINALWINALAIYAWLSRKVGQMDQAKNYARRTVQLKKRFVETFWFEEGGYLYDVVDGNIRDTRIRPNQIMAIGLPYPLLEDDKAKHVFHIVMDRLFTPFGLRSLAPEDPDYRPAYGGNMFQRDSAYHQGTVWSWLLGPFLTALVRIYGADGKVKGKKIIEELKPHLADAGIGSISEIFDADAPHAARGCIAQAWGVGEILRAYTENLHG